MDEKHSLRQLAQQKRDAITGSERRQKEAAIHRNLTSLAELQKAVKVLFYYSVKSEVSTHELLDKYQSKKNIWLPVVQKNNTFTAAPLNKTSELRKGIEGIPEPTTAHKNVIFDVIIVPGLAFDKNGHRLGTGKGYYDRFLAGQSATRIALAFQEQLFEKIPQSAYDESVDIIVTDEAVIRCS